jgi:hypothetical protein
MMDPTAMYDFWKQWFAQSEEEKRESHPAIGPGRMVPAVQRGAGLREARPEGVLPLPHAPLEDERGDE